MSEVAPTPPRNRLLSLDVLRGFALLGILVINIRYFAGPLGWTNQPAMPGGELRDLDFWTWFGGTLFFEEKMIALFSMLFGAGLVLTAGRKMALHLSRHFWLFVIGATHAFLLWHGDVLMIYAACGLLLTPLRRASAALLLPLGITCVLGSIGTRAWQPLVDTLGPPLVEAPIAVEEGAAEDPGAGLEDGAADAEQTPELSDSQLAWGDLMRREMEAHQGGYVQHFRWRAKLNLWWHFYGGLFNLLRCGGFMLIGMALMRAGVLSGRRGPKLEWSMMWAGMLLGGALTLAGMQPHLARILGQDSLTDPSALQRAGVFGLILMHSAAGFVTLGWVGLLLLLCRLPAAFVLLRPVVAVGRAALSNYLAATLVCVIVFEGWGMGHFAEWGPARQLRLVLWIWAGQVLVSTLWLMMFRFGPVEWLWRSLTFLCRQPMFRANEPGVAAASPGPPVSATYVVEATPKKAKRRFFKLRKAEPRSMASTKPITVATASSAHPAQMLEHVLEEAAPEVAEDVELLIGSTDEGAHHPPHLRTDESEDHHPEDHQA